MQEIEIDFDVFKALTAKRRSEAHSFNDVLREMLDLGSTVYEEHHREFGNKFVSLSVSRRGEAIGFALAGKILPNGTCFRAKYKGRVHLAEIVDGRWVNEDGKAYGSPSAAASAITGNNVNGWRFWELKRPSDAEWRSLESMGSRNRN